jgi:GntR family transcriptional regulator, transcriptional repressor for pyruvate dehydrogenase complex
MKSKKKPDPVLGASFTPRPTEDRVKVADSIIESLRLDIVTRRLAAGAKMPSERSMAESFGVSQPTVREVLRALETMGLVDVYHGSGTYVSHGGGSGLASALLTLMQLERVTLSDVQFVRRILGVESVKFAARRASSDQIDAIEAALLRLDEVATLTSASEMLSRVLAFQEALSTAANHSLIRALEMFLATLITRIQVNEGKTSRDLKARRTRFLGVQPQRRAVLEAIRNRDPERAQAAATDYFDVLGSLLERDPRIAQARLSDPLLSESLSGILREFRATHQG